MTAAMSATVREKAQRLVDEGRVHLRQGGEVFDVQGDTGWHVVQVPQRRLDRDGTCTRCKAYEFGRQCSHIMAAKLAITAADGGETT